MQWSRYYRTKLDDTERAVYDGLVVAMEAIKPEVQLPSFAPESLNRIVYALNFDNPHLFYVDFYKSQFWITETGAKASLVYKHSLADIRMLQQKIDREVAPIVKAARGKKGKELASYLHDRLVRRGTYREDETHPDDAHTIVGLLLYNECVCEGYAKTFQYLADLTGLLSLVVTGHAIHPDGTGGGHAWNIVKLGGQCYQVDVTFDHLVGKRFCSRAYFCLSTREITYDHQFSPMFPVPDCPSYGGDLKLVSGTRELMDCLARECRNGATFSEMRLSKGFAQGELIDMVAKKVTESDRVWYNKIQSFWYGEQNKSVFVTWDYSKK